MRVTSVSDERLVVEHRPRGLVLFAWGMAAAAVVAGVADDAASTGERAFAVAFGLGLAGLVWWLVPFRRVVFDRSRGTVERSEWRPFRRRLATLPLGRVRRAVRLAGWADGSRINRVALELDDGTLPLGRGRVRRQLQPLEETINEWLPDRPYRTTSTEQGT